MSVYSAPWYTPAVQRLLDLALEEDVGRGDVTTRGGHRRDAGGRGATSSPASGWSCAAWASSRRCSPASTGARACACKVADGDPVAPDHGRRHRARAGGGAAGGRADRAELPAAPVGHRHAHPGVRGARPRAPSCASPTRARRMPGLRALEKYAVRVGRRRQPPRRSRRRASSSRTTTSRSCGSVREAVRRARANAPHGLRIGGRGRHPGAARRGARGGRRGRSCSTTSRPAT